MITRLISDAAKVTVSPSGLTFNFELRVWPWLQMTVGKKETTPSYLNSLPRMGSFHHHVFVIKHSFCHLVTQLKTNWSRLFGQHSHNYQRLQPHNMLTLVKKDHLVTPYCCYCHDPSCFKPYCNTIRPVPTTRTSFLPSVHRSWARA